MSAKHTPSPWVNSNGVIVPAVKQRADVYEQIADVKMRVRAGGPSAEGEANARLIAAAPDLLVAARFALSVLKANPIEMSERLAIEKLESVIASAEGKSQPGSEPKPARLDAYDQCECGQERREHVPGGAAADLDGCSEFRLAYRYLATTPPPARSST